MLTRDPTLILWFNRSDPPCDRVFGFMCGYNAVFGKSKNFRTTEEYQQGWEEGKDLRFDEMKAAHRAGKIVP
jgi:hypothetical protein